eukprot:556823-Prymnesium_polylepis.1
MFVNAPNLRARAVRIGNVHPTASGARHMRPERIISVAQHSLLLPSRRSQPRPPHLPHEARQQTVLEP